MTKSETWKDVAEYEGFYQVSNKGNVYSVGRVDSRGHRRRGRILKPKYDRGGYLTVNLCKNGKMKTKKVHRLVAGAFLPNPNGLPQVNHRDEDKDNNNVENLEWCDARYNSNHGTRNERMAQAQSKKVRAVNAKTGDVVEFNSTAEAGRKGYHCGVVSMACRGVYKNNKGDLVGGDGRTYKGFRWYYDVEEENVSNRVSVTTGI